MKTDEIRINILPDGTIKMDSDGISMPNHSSAEQFVKETSRLAGGKTSRKSKKGHTHTGHHHHEGEHEHHEH